MDRELDIIDKENLGEDLSRSTSKSLTSNKSNLKENLLSRLGFFKKKNEEEEGGKSINKTGRFRKFLKRASALYEAHESDEDIDDEEVIHKVEFNKKVEEMAKYYMNETEISKFYPKQFMETLMIHLIYFLFGPILTPIYFKLWGKDFMRNMGFWGKKVKSSHFIQIFYWCCFLITVLLTIWIRMADEQTMGYYQISFLTPAYIANIMVLIRYTIVCVKYGFFPPEYYQKWKTSRLTRTEVKSNYLLQGWIRPSLLTLDVYLREIFQKYNLDVNEFKFQLAGPIPPKLSNSLREIDSEISEEASRIRRSIVRRLNKQKKLNNFYQDSCAKKKSKEIGLKRNFTTKNENNCNSLGSSFHSHRSKSIHIEHDPTKPSHALKRLREFIKNKILPEIKKKLKSEKESREESKIKILNENLREIKGIYLCRTILKNTFTPILGNYLFLLLTIVFINWLSPFIFTYLFYFTNIEYISNTRFSNLNDSSNINISSIYSNISSFVNVSLSNITSSKNITNSTIINDPDNTFPISKMAFHSYIILAFSAIALVPPIYLNTLNLLYGIIDIKRKNNLMQIITELINCNIKETNREYPLLNITSANTMLNWYYLRIIVLTFGQRFSNRIILQTSVFCIFIVLAIAFSVMSLFGFFNRFISMCLGISFTFSVLINCMIIFRMFLLGAQFNFYEFLHHDLIMTHKLFIDELMCSHKLTKALKRSASVSNNPEEVYQYSKKAYTKNSFSHNSLIANPKEEEKFEFFAGNNLSSDLLFKIASTDESFIKHGDNGLFKSSRIMENLKDKIKIDAIVRPLKIFWIKSDYGMVSRLVALMGTGIVMILSNMMKNIDLSKVFKH